MTKRKQIESNNKERKELTQKLQKGQIIVMISQMFLNCLRRGYLKLSDCMFIVFDECHHCNG
jgi:ERCC4-related helicase